MSGAPSKPEGKSFTFRAFVSDGESFDALRNFATSQGMNPDCVFKGNVDDAVEFLSKHPSPDFLVVDVASAEEAPGELDKLADVCDPSTKVVVTSTVDEYSFFRWLTEIGIHHYLLKPLTPENLKTAFSAATGSASTPAAVRRGKLIAVIGTRGGVGSSSVALNLAAVMANHHHVDTALLDLEPQWGTASLMLDLEPGRGLREALAKPDRIDALFMDRVLLKYNEHFAILSSEEPFDEPVVVHEDAAAALLKETRQKFGVVIADLPREISPFTQAVLREADHVVVVSELSLICLRDAMRLQDFLTGKLKVKKLHLVANRTGLLGKYQMPATDFERSVGGKIEVQIPFDLEAQGKMATGHLPVLEKEAGPMAKSIIELAAHLHKTKEGAEPAAKQKPKIIQWLKKGHAS